MSELLNPQEAFSQFLSSSLQEAWVHSWTWQPIKRGSLNPRYSKSHKENSEGELIQIEVESADDFRTGIDLEFFMPNRPLFQNPDWLERKFKIPEDTIKSLTKEELLEEWAYREAAFKALYPFNKGVVLTDFVRTGKHQLAIDQDVDGKETRFVFDLRGEWQDTWFMALARRSL